MADDSDLRIEAIEAAVAVVGADGDVHKVVDAATVVYAFLVGGVPASAPAQPADEPAPLPVDAPADANAEPVAA